MPLIDSATLLSIIEDLVPVFKWLIIAVLLAIVAGTLLRTKIGKILVLACVVVFLVNQGTK